MGRRLVNDEALSPDRAARLIVLDLQQRLPKIWDRGHVVVGELWSYYTDYAFTPRRRDRGVLDAGIKSAADVMVWETDAFAIAESYDGAHEQ